MEISRPKLSQAHGRMPKGYFWLRNHRKSKKKPGGRYFRNFWVGMCRWDPEIVNLYTELQVVQLNVVTLY